MSHRKLQKEVDTIFKKINEGVDLFNYYYTRHQSSNNDSQREKLEGDLKKEIKKLQKFRDQIKTWQLNESIEATIDPSRLQEHRRLVEEAMECYKDVEKSSKMKSYSNQSIMLAALELEEVDLSPEAGEAMDFLVNSIDELNNQVDTLESEYEKLSQKKIRKKNSTAIEERKQEIEALNSRNRFHVEKLEQVVDFLKKDKIDPELVFAIQDDIGFYLESNQEPDFVDDENLYEELFKESTKPRPKHRKESNDDSLLASGVDLSLNNEPGESENGGTSPPKKPVDDSTNVSTVSSNGSSPPPQAKLSTPQKVQPVVAPPTPESSSPAIIKSLKFVAAPQKPAGNLKWAAAAAAAAIPRNALSTPLNSANSNSTITSASSPILTNSTPSSENFKRKSADTEISDDVSNITYPNLVSPVSDKSKHVDGANGSSLRNSVRSQHLDYALQDGSFFYPRITEVLENSSISKIELDLFKDINLVRLPPGIQDLIISFTATRKVTSSDSKIIINTDQYNPYTTPIKRSFLPRNIQSSFNKYLPQIQGNTIKPPLHLLKFQSYWNHIRAGFRFEQIVNEIQLLRSTSESEQLSNELTMVFFYGYYYGFTPLENLIAESCLFKLNWRPYSPTGSSPEPQDLMTKVGSLSAKQYYYWFKCIKVLSNDEALSNKFIEFGDYQVFDLITWEIYIKYSLKLDSSTCQLEPTKSLC